jgi:hypothetical protein
MGSRSFPSNKRFMTTHTQKGSRARLMRRLRNNRLKNIGQRNEIRLRKMVIESLRMSATRFYKQ